MLFDFAHSLWVFSFITIWALISQFAFIKYPRRPVPSELAGKPDAWHE